MNKQGRGVADVRFGGRQTPHGYLFELTGGRPCLDLANTLDERLTDHPKELLRSYADVLDWALQAGAIDRADARDLRAGAEADPAAAHRALADIVRSREAIFRVFSAVAGGRTPPADALAVLNGAVAQAGARRRIDRSRGVFSWTWNTADGADLDRVLWSAAWSAAELLTSPDLPRVRQCAGAGCAWLFLDTSKNRTRRWCDMSVCGNRAKARRHYRKISSE